jgi:hypothetical protein
MENIRDLRKTDTKLRYSKEENDKLKEDIEAKEKSDDDIYTRNWIETVIRNNY